MPTKTMVEWRPEDNGNALMEGWNVFECDGSDNGFYQICVLEEPGLNPALGYTEKKFEDDCAVWIYVWNRAFEDYSPLHLRAIMFIMEHNPTEFTAITSWVRDHQITKEKNETS